MSTITTTAPAGSTFPAPSFSFASLVDVLFMTKLREELDAEIAGDKSDAAFTYGM
jgi:hypothetical protein